MDVLPRIGGTLPWLTGAGKLVTTELVITSREGGALIRNYINTHMMPTSEDKAKRAVDSVFQRLEEAANDPLCGPNVAPHSL